MALIPHTEMFKKPENGVSISNFLIATEYIDRRSIMIGAKHRIMFTAELELSIIFLFQLYQTITIKLYVRCLDASKDPIARKLRLRRGRRDTENSADQDQAKILKVFQF